jgi:CRP-like cAMP-binding protein
MPEDKLSFLKSIRLFSRIPDDQLKTLGEFLTTETFQDGGVVFEEGSPGDSLYFVSSGNVVIAKKLRSDEDPSDGIARKDLAVLGPGDCFGEMALLEADQPRSADALARGETSLCRLGRAELSKWLEANPQLAIGFFAQLVELLSSRLRHSSNELTLLFDLSSLLLEPFSSVKELLDKFMRRRMQYLEGDWCSGAYVYNEFNDEMDLVDVEGDFKTVEDSLNIPPAGTGNHWIDDRTYQVIFPGEKRCMGYIVFHRKNALDDEEKNEVARTLTTTARLVTSALVQLNFRLENEMRDRLSSNRQTGRL